MVGMISGKGKFEFTVKKRVRVMNVDSSGDGRDELR